MLNNIKSKYILNNIIKDHIQKRIYYLLAQYNKILQEKLELNIEDYKKLHKRLSLSTELEIIPIFKKLEPDIKYYFIRRLESKDYYHIYFNNSHVETQRNYIINKDIVDKIKIKIDMEIKSLRKLFNECFVIKEIKFTRFNRDDFTDLSEMFYGCKFLDKLDIKLFKTNNVTKMNWMFTLCESLSEIDIRNFDTNKVTEMMNLFSGCYRLKKIEFNFNTENVISMRNMFFGCKSLRYIDVSNFDTSNVKDFSEMFSECINLENLDIEKFNLVSRYRNKKDIINVSGMFGGCNKSITEKLSSDFTKDDLSFIFKKKE